jgi:serine/threonine-protein kinase
VIDPVPGQALHVRTEISRRIVAKDAGVTPTGDEAHTPSVLSPGSPQRPARIRILDPDDERRKLDPYELIGEIASGGMATVYLGRLAGHGGFSRFVAIKQLHPHLAREEQFVQMFLDEARLAAGIHNPHVVPILEVGMSKAGYFLVMEFIEGDTLAGLTARSLASGGILPAPVALRIVVDALTGLHAAHQLADGEGQHLGLVHRDCTPQNILVGVDGSARITDFGVARAASRLAITRPQQVKGKVAYLSPEQAHAMDLDRRSDIFTMGIVLWEALAGRPLFQAESEAVTLSRLVSGPIPSVRSFVPDVPTSLDDICRRALYRDRNRRFRTAAEMAEALERAAEVEGFAGVASPRELGKFVEATMGAELAAQREAVRAGLLASSGAPRISLAHPSRPPPSLRGYEARLSSRDAPAASSPAPKAGEEAPQLSARPPAEKVAAATTPEAAVAREPRDEEGIEKTRPAATAAVPKKLSSMSDAAGRVASAPGPLPVTPTGARARLDALVARVSARRMSTGRGLLLAMLVVLIATAPLWLRGIKRALRGSPSKMESPVTGRAAATELPRSSPSSDIHGAGSIRGAVPAPLPIAASPSKPQPAWDEGDWGLPEAGLDPGSSARAPIPAER